MTTVTIQLPERIERELRALGAIDLSAAVLEIVEKSISAPLSASPDRLSETEWLAQFHAWAGSRPAYGVVADFDRDSIYEGRGE